MPKRTQGNGDSKGKIHFEHICHGHVVAYPDNTSALPDDYPLILSSALTKWLEDNPAIRIRSVLPIVQNGQTIVLHLWFDQ